MFVHCVHIHGQWSRPGLLDTLFVDRKQRHPSNVHKRVIWHIFGPFFKLRCFLKLMASWYCDAIFYMCCSVKNFFMLPCTLRMPKETSPCYIVTTSSMWLRATSATNKQTMETEFHDNRDDMNIYISRYSDMKAVMLFDNEWMLQCSKN